MKGWTSNKLSDVTSKIGSGATPKGGKNAYKAEGVSLIRSMNVHDSVFKEKNLAFIDDAQAERLSNVIVEENDVLLNITGASIARCCIVSKDVLPARVNQHVSILRPKKGIIESRFLAYLLISNQYKTELLVSADKAGATREALTKTQLQIFEILYPSIPEQKRIVTILDQAFADIEQARAKTEQNLINARELFESYLQQVSGEKKSLGEFVTIKTGKLNSNAAVAGGEFPFFTCSRDVFSINQFSFDCEAILLAGNNASGDFNVKHYKGKFDAYQRTYVITINEGSQILYHFLYYQMLKSLKDLKESSVGAGTKFLKLGMIKNLKISIPPIDDQKKILDILLALKDEVDKLEGIYQIKLAALDELKKSILHLAFTGQLTLSLEPAESKGAAA